MIFVPTFLRRPVLCARVLHVRWLQLDTIGASSVEIVKWKFSIKFAARHPLSHSKPRTCQSL